MANIVKAQCEFALQSALSTYLAALEKKFYLYIHNKSSITLKQYIYKSKFIFRIFMSFFNQHY